MNSKNLPLKLAFVLAAVLLCAWSIHYGKGLRQGIDLRGGHSLVFEIRSNQSEIERLKEDRDLKQKQLDAATDPQQEQTLEAALAAIDKSLKNEEAQGASETAKDIPDRIISILKKRIDPQGWSSLEWRPVGANRIEVRMPAGSDESIKAKEAYAKALDKLDADNLSKSKILRVLNAQGPQRQEQINNIAGSDTVLAGLLQKYAAANDRLQSVQGKGSQGAVLDAEAAVTLAERELLKGNISRVEMEEILKNDLSDTEAEGLKKEEVVSRRAMFRDHLAKLKAEHPARVEQIQEVVAAYEKWTKVRKHLDDPSDLQRLIAKAGVLEFRIAPTLPGAGRENAVQISQEEYDRFTRVLKEEGPEGLRRITDKYRWFPVQAGEDRMPSDAVTCDAQGQTFILLFNEGTNAMMHSNDPSKAWSLKRAFPTSDSYGRPAVGFEFDERGALLCGELTGNNIGHYMAILLDDEVFSAPVINARITNNGIIEGSFTVDQVNENVRELEAGSLPAKLNPVPVAINSFGATFGEENLKSALYAGKVAAIAIIVFMLAYYIFAGAIANVALIINTVLVLGAMSIFGAVFTLPGIAGVILAIGMAVDSNVLIYERLREEQHKGLPIRMALKNAYDRAFSAILDCHVTTLLTCIILGWLGTEEVKGFGITLGLGVVFNFFTAVFMTRWIFQLFVEHGWVKKHITMMHIRTPVVNWMAKRYYFWAFSLITAVLGVWALAQQGRDVFGIEFSSGTQAIVSFKDDALIDGKLPNDNDVYSKFFAAAAGNEKLLSTARVETLHTNQLENFLRDHAKGDERKITRPEWINQGMDPAFFDQLAKKAGATDTLTADQLQKVLPAKSYQISTTESRVSLIQDVVNKAFGPALERRQSIDFDLVKGGGGKVQPNLGISLADTGWTRIDHDLAQAVKNPEYRSAFIDAEGGVLFVLDVKTPLTATEVVQRLREMRFQPDSQVTGNSSEVIGLEPAGKDKYASFAVLAKPGDAKTAAKWNDFAQSEFNLVQDSLHRQEAILATNFDAAIAGTARQQAVMAVILSWLVICVYLWVRFGQARWGLAAVICLIHDVVIAVGMVAASAWLSKTTVGHWLGINDFKIDLAMIGAFLTIVGYSVNDTIVVFDRIRENRGKLTTVTPQVINASINQTLSRTLLTSSTVLLVVAIMYVLGGEGIHAFNYALLIGIAFGTYSSIAVASPILLGFKEMIVTHTLASEQPVAGK